MTLHVREPEQDKPGSAPHGEGRAGRTKNGPPETGGPFVDR